MMFMSLIGLLCVGLLCTFRTSFQYQAVVYVVMYGSWSRGGGEGTT